MHIHKLGVEFHKYSLMKMFMTSLEGNARSWYEWFPAGSLYSLEDFHTLFHEHFKDQYPSLLLVVHPSHLPPCDLTPHGKMLFLP